MSEYQERREWTRKLRDFMDGPNAGTCPVCYTNLERLVEEQRREVERLSGEAGRLRGTLEIIAGQDHTHVNHEDGPTLVLDADEKMRRIARNALAGADPTAKERS